MYSSPSAKRHMAVRSSEQLSSSEVFGLASKGKIKRALALDQYGNIDPANIPISTPPSAKRKKTYVVELSDKDFFVKALEGVRKDLEEKIASQGAELTATQAKLTATEAEVQKLGAAVTQGQAVALRFLLDYLHEVTMKASKSYPNLKACLEAAAARTQFPITIHHTHSCLGNSGLQTFNLSPLVDVIKRKGRLAGGLSEDYCHSSDLRTIAAALLIQLQKAQADQAALLGLQELQELKTVFQALFGVDAESVVNDTTTKAFVETFKLPNKST